MKRTATSVWKGSGTGGSGSLTTQSGVFDEQPYSFKTRFENEDGKEGTNPEELIGAAHAGCFNMALSVQLGKEDYTPDELETKATVEIEKQGEGFKITKITLDLTATIPEIEEGKFQEIAKAAKEGCPVSQALSAVDIDLNATLR